MTMLGKEREYQELANIRLALNQLLDQRDILYPKRDPQSTKATRETLTAYVNAIKSIKEPNWTVDNKLIDSVKDISKECLFICGYMKSGTSLLLQLLDSHPELIVMPGDFRMISWINNHRNMPWTEYLKEWDTQWLSHLINPTGHKPFWILGENETPYLDFLHYLDYWLERLPSSDCSPFLAVVLAFYCANPRRAPIPKLWVEKTPGNELNVDKILDLFPSARFIHIVRDPRSTLASIKRLQNLRKRNWNAEDFAYVILKSIKTGFINQERLGEDRYHIVRYEDILTNTEEEMKKIALFLGIKMDEILLRPTVNGIPAKSNTMFKDRMIQGKILTTLSDKWRTELDSFEQKTILAILYLVAKRLGYEWSHYLNYFQARFHYLMFRIIRHQKTSITKWICGK